jgi:hypothetical protein
MAGLSRLLTLALFAWALALRAWVPAGWMPAPGAHSFAIMPCPAAAPSATMHMGHDPAHHDHSSSGGDCFSPLLAGAALPDPLAVITAPSPAPAGERISVAPARLERAETTLPPPSTGPPALA